MNYKIVIASNYEPVALADLKQYLNILAAYTDKDDLLSALALSAKEYIERFTKRFLGRTKVEQYWDAWPADRIMTLATGVATSVCEVAYWDGEAWALVAETEYYTDLSTSPARVKLLDSPQDPGEGLATVKVTYWAGEDDGTDIPQPLLVVLRRLVAFWFEKPGGDPMPELHGILKQYIINR